LKVSVLSDANWESKLDHAMRPLELRSYFEGRDYGSGLSGIVVVLMCRDPGLPFEQRIQMVQATGCLYVDVMLPLPAFASATHAMRRQLLADALVDEVLGVLERKKPKRFDAPRFTGDLRAAVAEQLLGPDASRFDASVLERANGC
jgi:hypothetical protein